LTLFSTLNYWSKFLCYLEYYEQGRCIVVARLVAWATLASVFFFCAGHPILVCLAPHHRPCATAPMWNQSITLQDPGQRQFVPLMACGHVSRLQEKIPAGRSVYQTYVDTSVFKLRPGRHMPRPASRRSRPAAVWLQSRPTLHGAASSEEWRVGEAPQAAGCSRAAAAGSCPCR